MRSAKAWATLAALAGAAFLTSCTQGKSYIVVTLKAQPAQPIAGVARIRLELSAEGILDSLTYAAKPGPTLEISPVNDTTLSVSFTESITGKAMLSATALDANGVALGYGDNTNVQIAAGRIAYATVIVMRGARPPINDGAINDGGTDDGGGDGGLMMCEPTAAGGCALGQTCGLSCLKSSPTTKCSAAGTKQPGEPCTGDGQCAPGSQCFRNTMDCGVSTCRKFCSTNAGCGDGVCFTESSCGDPPVASGVRTCSQPCDPRGTGATGCATGLRCFLFPGEVVDCDCGSPRRVAVDGAPCVDSGDCMTGLLCVTMQAASVCRPICKLSEPGTCATDRMCEKLMNPSYEVYGACIPK